MKSVSSNEGAHPKPIEGATHFKKVRTGLFAPAHSLRFLLDNKLLLFIGLAPQVLGLVCFVWLAAATVIPAAETAILSLLPLSWDGGVVSGVVAIGVILILVIAYAVIWVPLMSTLASPLYDFIAGQTYQKVSGRALAPQKWRDMIRGIVSEATKLFVYILFIIMGLLLPPLSPLIIMFTIWYLGWDLMDRTLLLTGRSFRERIAFGLRHIVPCLTLGLWVYFPLVGALLGFAFACAGAISVAQLEKFRESESTKGREALPS